MVAVVGLVYGVGTVYSGRSIDRRIRRSFSLAWATLHLFTVVGIPVAALTWAVLSRPSARELYDGNAVPFEPRMRPPPVPLPVLALSAGEVLEDVRGVGR